MEKRRTLNIELKIKEFKSQEQGAEGRPGAGELGVRIKDIDQQMNIEPR